MRFFRPDINGMERNRNLTGLVRVLLDDPEDDLRRQAGQTLERLKSPKISQLLMQGLKSTDIKARFWAAWCLGLIKDPSTIGALIEATKDPFQDASHRYPVREQAAKALEGMPSQDMRGNMMNQSVEQLIDTVSFGPSALRAAAAEALGRTKDRKGFEPLVRALSSSETGLKNAAITALGNLGDERAIVYLLRARKMSGDGNIGWERRSRSHPLYYSKDPYMAAVSEIGSVGIDALADALQNGVVDPVFVMNCYSAIGSPKAVKYILPWLEVQEDEIRSAAAQALGNISAPDSVTALLKELERAGKPLVRLEPLGSRNRDTRLTATRQQDTFQYLEVVVKSLGNLRAVEAVLPLTYLINMPNEHATIVIIEALANIGDPDTVSVLGNLIPNAAEGVLIAIARALGKLNVESSIPLLVQLLQNESDSVRRAALNVMRQHKRTEFLAALNAFQSGEDLELMRLLLETINDCGGDPIPMLNRMLHDEKANARLFSICMFIQYGQYPKKDICEMLLLDSDYPVRWGAASLLWLSGEPLGDYNLSLVLRETSSTSRHHLQRYYRATEILKSSEPRAILAIVSHLGHDDLLVRKGASKVLLQLGRVAEPLLANALDSQNVRMRRRAAEVLSLMPNFSMTIHITFKVDHLMPVTKARLQQALTKERDRGTASMMQKAIQQS